MIVNKRFEGRYVIINSAASGIGRSTAIYLAEQGASLSLAHLNLEGLKEVSAAIDSNGGVLMV